MLRLKKELNFLLWTSDVPEVPDGLPSLIRATSAPEPVKINMQCAAHMAVCAGIFARRGFGVTTRSGMAFVLDTCPDHNRDNDLLNQIAKHWWLSLDDQGVVDLSLFSESENPLICCNRSVGGRWIVDFGENPEKAQRFLKNRQRGCFYLTGGKKRISDDELTQSLAELFSPPKAHGVAVSYRRIVEYCERVLCDPTQTLTCESQVEAWRKLQT